jgi:hypothetical protein
VRTAQKAPRGATNRVHCFVVTHVNGALMSDLVFVLLSLAVFAVLALCAKGAEKL